MTNSEIITTIIAGLFAAGGAGWAVVAEAFRLRDTGRVEQ